MRLKLILGSALLILLALLVGGCAGRGAPTDAEARAAIRQFIDYRDISIYDKSECELSANRKAEGISERWIVRFTATGVLSGNKEDLAYTIQKVNGEWTFWRWAASCGP